jgi:hypothetical protein
MKATQSILGCLVLLVGVAAAGDETDRAKLSETMLKAIARLEENPFKAKGDGTVAIIATFADKSDSVLIEVNTGYIPWLERKGKNDDVLLAAFIAGNVRPQLVQRVKKNHPVAGLQFMLAVYARLLKDCTF